MLISKIADVVELHSTCNIPMLSHKNIHWHGTLSPDAWNLLLRESKVECIYYIYIYIYIISRYVKFILDFYVCMSMLYKK